MLAVQGMRSCTVCRDTWEIKIQHIMGGHMWEGEIMPVHCQHLCTLGREGCGSGKLGRQCNNHVN